MFIYYDNHQGKDNWELLNEINLRTKSAKKCLAGAAITNSTRVYACGV